jgi:hypothetical protein
MKVAVQRAISLRSGRWPCLQRKDIWARKQHDQASTCTKLSQAGMTLGGFKGLGQAPKKAEPSSKQQLDSPTAHTSIHCPTCGSAHHKRGMRSLDKASSNKKKHNQQAGDSQAAQKKKNHSERHPFWRPTGHK